MSRPIFPRIRIRPEQLEQLEQELRRQGLSADAVKIIVHDLSGRSLTEKQKLARLAEYVTVEK